MAVRNYLFLHALTECSGSGSGSGSAAVAMVTKA